MIGFKFPDTISLDIRNVGICAIETVKQHSSYCFTVVYRQIALW